LPSIRDDEAHLDPASPYPIGERFAVTTPVHIDIDNHGHAVDVIWDGVSKGR